MLLQLFSLSIVFFGQINNQSDEYQHQNDVVHILISISESGGWMDSERIIVIDKYSSRGIDVLLLTY